MCDPNIHTINHLMTAADFPPPVFLYCLVTIGAIMILLLRGTLVNNHESIKETASNNDCLMQIFLGRHPPRTI